MITVDPMRARQRLSSVTVGGPVWDWPSGEKLRTSEPEAVVRLPVN